MAPVPVPQARDQASPTQRSPAVMSDVPNHDMVTTQDQQSDARFAPGYANAIHREMAAALAMRQRATPAQIAAAGIQPTFSGLAEAARAPKRLADEECDMNRAHKKYLGGPSRHVEDRGVDIPPLPNDFVGKYSKLPQAITGGPFAIEHKMHPDDTNFDFISSLCTSRELIITVCQHLKPRDVLALMKASKLFYQLFRESFKSNIWHLANGMAPASARIFFWKFYKNLLVPDPTGALPDKRSQRFVFPWSENQPVAEDEEDGGKPRMVPSLGWLHLVVERERQVRDIIACLARSGHRLPREAHTSLKKMWLLMDCGLNVNREALIRYDPIFSDFDIYNLQMFFIKLQMRFSEPIFGPNSSELMQVLLGQREGLRVMWQMLRRKKYTDDLDACVQMKVRYDHEITMSHFVSARPIHGVPLTEVGLMNLEGWGTGNTHLKRPPELVIKEAARRGLRLSCHYLAMAVWGHVDIKKKKNLVPTEEEVYMSDDELPPFHPRHPDAKCGNVPFHPDEWQPKHMKKARWHTLTKEEKAQIEADDIDEQLRDLVYEELPSDGEFDDDPYGADFDLVPKDTVRSATWDKPSALEPVPTSFKNCFNNILKKSNYDQAQQDAEMSALAAFDVEQSQMEMDLDDYISDVGSLHTNDPMDVDEDSNGIAVGDDRGRLQEVAKDNNEDRPLWTYEYRRF